jgi:hypothetical protein
MSHKELLINFFKKHKFEIEIIHYIPFFLFQKLFATFILNKVQNIALAIIKFFKVTQNFLILVYCDIFQLYAILYIFANNNHKKPYLIKIS